MAAVMGLSLVVLFLSLVQSSEAYCYGYCVYSMWYFWFGLFWMIVVIIVLIVSCCKKKQMQRRRVLGYPGGIAVATVTGPTQPQVARPAVKPMEPPAYDAMSEAPPAYSTVHQYPPAVAPNQPPTAYPYQQAQAAYPPQFQTAPYPPQMTPSDPAYPPASAPNSMPQPNNGYYNGGFTDSHTTPYPPTNPTNVSN